MFWFKYRYYTQCARPKPWEDDKIKAYALCPWFADTDLLKDSMGVNETEKETRESLSNYFRVLNVGDVGDAFEQALDTDDNGGVFIVFPDTPIIKFPELNQLFVIPVIAYAKLMGLLCPHWKSIDGVYAIPLWFLLICALLYLLFCFIF